MLDDPAVAQSVDTQLAQRLKQEREGRGWSLADLAQRSGVSRAMISRIERGEASPTATLLGRLSAAFGLTLSQLFARAEGGGQLARLDAQPTWRDPATGFRRRSLSPPGAGRLELVWGELPPRAEIGYPAAALAFTETHQVVLLEGLLEIGLGDQVFRLAPGDCLHFGPPAATLYRNPGDTLARYIVALVRAAH